MKKITNPKNITLIVFALLLLIQLFSIDKTTVPPDQQKDFIAVNKPDASVENLLQSTCYDCHSNQTNYPWYCNIAPVSWWIKHHVNEGREELNFSEWATYSAKRKDHKLEECVEMLQENEMPLKSYTWLHPEANLTNEQRQLLVVYFNSLRVTSGGENEKE